MKLFIVAALSSLVLAAPAVENSLDKRQGKGGKGRGGKGAKSLGGGGGAGNCSPAFVFARGSGERAPLVSCSMLQPASHVGIN